MNKNNTYPIIVINDDYRIIAESNNRTLQKHRTERLDKKTNKIIECDIWDDIAYCANVYQCLCRIMNDDEIKPYEHISTLVGRMETMFEELKEVAEKYER